MTYYRCISKACSPKTASLVPVGHHSPVNFPVSLHTYRTVATSSRLSSTKAKYFFYSLEVTVHIGNKETHVHSLPSLLGLSVLFPHHLSNQQGKREASFSWWNWFFFLLSSIYPCILPTLSYQVFQPRISELSSAQHPTAPHHFHKANGQQKLYEQEHQAKQTIIHSGSTVLCA